MARIMVIDDEKYIREWYAMEFSDIGHEVITAGPSFKLIEKIKIFQPDLIILDIKLGDFNGLELLQEIRGCQPDLSVVICSAYDSYRHDIRALAADYYVVKSFDLSELKAKVDRALDANLPLLAAV